MVAIARYAKGGISVKDLKEMPFDRDVIVRNAVMELIRIENEEATKASKKWKR